MSNHPMIWQCRDHRFEIGSRPLVMGIVNVTPDSFSDGGNFSSQSAAIAHGLALTAQGADLLDIGGESTRPGAASVELEVELERVVPVVAELTKRVAIPISVDTSKATVARECLAVGAMVINDVTGLRADPAMPDVVASTRAGVIIMHMQGTPQTMQIAPRYADVVSDVRDFFQVRLYALHAAGISLEAICLDTGIGFGKLLENNLELLANAGEFVRFGRPICLGVSRKGFIGALCDRGITERMPGSLAVNCFAAAWGTAHILRTHDVAATRDAAILLESINRYRR